MDTFFLIMVGIAALIALDLAALRWGFDSRRGRGDLGEGRRDW